MLVSQFNFNLPRELIATAPANPRDSARLLAVGNELKDKTVRDLPSFIENGDVVIFNDTRVIPAKLYGTRLDAKVEITLHKCEGIDTWKGFAKPARKLTIGSIFKIAEDFYATVLNKNEGEVTLKFNVGADEFYAMLEKYGTPPLPPYIERENKKPTKSDVENYQTIYAKHKGAVAAPTAGLHFTEELLEKIDARGATRQFVTLHVGAGTFLPVKVEDTKDHKMHSEYGIITQNTADIINEAKKNGKRVIAIGTTSLRLLESAACEDGTMKEFCGDTDIFITPGYKFKIVDVLVTNFHLPESTLFMLVSAFAGFERMQEAYKHAINNKYRFYSYGDACILSKKQQISTQTCIASL